MPNWTIIAPTALDEASIRGIVEKYRDEAAARSLPDPATLIAQQVDELRACIGFSGKYQLDADTTKVPRGLLPLVVRKVIREMSRSLGVALSDDDRADDKFYESRLDLVRQGDWPVETSDNPVATPAVQTSVVTPSIAPKPCRPPFPQREDLRTY